MSNRPTREDLIAVQELIQGMLRTDAAAQASSDAGAAMAHYVNRAETSLDNRLRLAFFMALTVPTMDDRYSLEEVLGACPQAISHVAVYLATRDSQTPTVH